MKFRIQFSSLLCLPLITGNQWVTNRWCTPLSVYDKTTAIVFVVNQLSPSSLGISPLITIHPWILPHSLVRSINLIVTGSLGFGSNLWNSLLSHGSPLTPLIDSLTHYAIGKWSSPLVIFISRRSVLGSISLPLGFLTQLSLSVLYTIAMILYLSFRSSLLGLFLVLRYLSSLASSSSFN